jgi:non-ribosomal peptide synthetase component F
VIHIDIFTKNDTIGQIARCSFDVHVLDILGTIMIGATLIMLHPGGTLDFEYLCTILMEKQITYMNSVPSLFHNFFTFLEDCNSRNATTYLRSVVSGGIYLCDKIVYFLISISTVCR